MTTRWRSVVIACCAVLALGVGIVSFAGAETKSQQIQRLSEQLGQEQAKFESMKVPDINQVGQAEYAKAAQENANQGQKVKSLQLEVGKLESDGHVTSPAEEVAQVENEMRASWNMINTLEPHLRKQIELGQSGYQPELNRLLEQKAVLETIQNNHKAKLKSSKELLQNLEDFRNIK